MIDGGAPGNDRLEPGALLHRGLGHPEGLPARRCRTAVHQVLRRSADRQAVFTEVLAYGPTNLEAYKSISGGARQSAADLARQPEEDASRQRSLVEREPRGRDRALQQLAAELKASAAAPNRKPAVERRAFPWRAGLEFTDQRDTSFRLSPARLRLRERSDAVVRGFCEARSLEFSSVNGKAPICSVTHARQNGRKEYAAMTVVAKDGVTAPKLVIEGLSKRYGDVTALEPTAPDRAEGEFLTLLGPSGSGKTTLLQMIAGWSSQRGPRVSSTGATRPRRRSISATSAWCSRTMRLFPHLTVAENIAFPLQDAAPCRGRDRHGVSRTRSRWFSSAIWPARFPRELSGGQQQRVALARCFVYQPSIILMDEPLGALDKKLREQMQLEIKRLHARLGATDHLRHARPGGGAGACRTASA